MRIGKSICMANSWQSPSLPPLLTNSELRRNVPVGEREGLVLGQQGPGSQAGLACVGADVPRALYQHLEQTLLEPQAVGDSCRQGAGVE